jgi:hypothetical protein
VASVCVPTVAWAGSGFCSCLAVAFDFNADGKADLIRSGPSGIRVDVLDGSASVANGTFPNGGALSLRAVGHLNHDFNADFVAQGAGHARVTFVNAAGIATAGTLYLSDGAGSWRVVDAADVNGDRVDEILFEGTGSATGSMRIANISSGSPVFSYLATGGGAWTYAFSADLDGDGAKDLLFRGTGAASGVTRVNRNGGTANVDFLAQGGGAWVLEAAGDLDGDGIDDLADVPNPASVGQDRVRVFDTAGSGNPSETGFVPNGGGLFTLKTLGDFTGDGRDDLAYDGPDSFRIVEMHGVAPAAIYFPPNGGGAFTLRRMGDTNGDGKSDLISTNAAGDVWIRVTNGETGTRTAARLASPRILPGLGLQPF